MDPIVLEVTDGVGWSSVDLMAGKQSSMGALTVRSLEGLISYICMAWLPARTEKKVSEQDVEVFKLLRRGNDWDFEGYGAIHQQHIL